MFENKLDNRDEEVYAEYANIHIKRCIGNATGL